MADKDTNVTAGETPVKEKKSPKKDKKEKKPGKVKVFWKGFFSELKKIVWPTPKQVVKNTLRVLAIMVICWIVIGMLDYAFSGGFVALTELFK